MRGRDEQNVGKREKYIYIYIYIYIYMKNRSFDVALPSTVGFLTKGGP